MMLFGYVVAVAVICSVVSAAPHHSMFAPRGVHGGEVAKSIGCLLYPFYKGKACSTSFESTEHPRLSHSNEKAEVQENFFKHILMKFEDIVRERERTQQDEMKDWMMHRIINEEIRRFAEE